MRREAPLAFDIFHPPGLERGPFIPDRRARQPVEVIEEMSNTLSNQVGRRIPLGTDLRGVQVSCPEGQERFALLAVIRCRAQLKNLRLARPDQLGHAMRRALAVRVPQLS